MMSSSCFSMLPKVNLFHKRPHTGQGKPHSITGFFRHIHDKYRYSRLDPAVVKANVLVVGDCGCGKTTLIEKCAKVQKVQESMDSFSVGVYLKYVQVSARKSVKMWIWDVPGYEDLDTILLPDEVDAIILCIDISRPETLDNSIQLYRAVRELYPRDPVLLVGCKIDLRNNIEVISRLADEKKITVTFQQAHRMATLMGAMVYVEATAKTNTRTTEDIFEAIALNIVGKLHRDHIIFQRQRTAQGLPRRASGVSVSSMASFRSASISSFRDVSERSHGCVVM